MVKNWYNTNIDFSNALTKAGHELIEELQREIDAENGLILARRFMDDEPAIIEQSWLKEFNDKSGVEMYVALLFARPANFTTPGIHIDGSRPGTKKPRYAFNWVHRGEDARMIWYKQEGQETIMSEKFGVNYHTFSDEVMPTFKEEDSIVMSNTNYLTLVRVDVPHDVICGQQPRISLTLRCRETLNSWEQAVEHFYNRGILE